jgi:DNA-binding CsgD family transcriptional regulator
LTDLTRGRSSGAKDPSATNAPGDTARFREEETGLGRRQPPFVYIFNEDQEALACFESPEPEDGAFPGGERDNEALVAMLRALVPPPGAGAARSFSAWPCNGKLSRAVRLIGSFSGYALLIEPQRRRDAIRDASVRGRLSARESEILELLVRGIKRSEIAVTLGIAEPTVQSHVRKLASKLGCKHRSEIVARALGNVTSDSSRSTLKSSPASHRAARFIECDPPDPSESPCESCRKAAKGACRRLPPESFLLDERFRPIALFDGAAASAEGLSGVERRVSELSGVIRAHFASENEPEEAYAEIAAGEDLIRVMPLRGALPGFFILVEPLRRLRAAGDAAIRYHLSRRESQVLEYLLQGKPSAEIAGLLGTSEATTLSHIHNIGVKMRCTRRTEIVARARGAMGRPESAACADASEMLTQSSVAS